MNFRLTPIQALIISALAAAVLVILAFALDLSDQAVVLIAAGMAVLLAAIVLPLTFTPRRLTSTATHTDPAFLVSEGQASPGARFTIRNGQSRRN